MDTLTGTFHALRDPRTEDQKKTDFTHEDVLTGSIPQWIQAKTIITLDQRYQSTSTSCIPQSGAKAITKFTGIVATALPVFDSRSNFPQPAMFLQEACDLYKNLGTDTEAKYPSQNMTDDQMNAMKVAFANLPFKIASYYTLPSGTDPAFNMDLYAEALDLGHVLLIGLESNADEYNYIPVVNGAVTFSHCVSCHSSNYILHVGGTMAEEKCLVIDDSANAYSSINGQRILTETFIKARVWGVVAFVPLVPPTTPAPATPVKPVHTFDTTKEYQYVQGAPQVYAPEVLALQQCLAYLGFFKPALINGYFGPQTKLSVINFQNTDKDFILVPAGLTNATGIVSYHTLTYLNSLFAPTK